jgi:hypothetical protein
LVADIVVFNGAIRSASVASVVIAIVAILGVFAKPITALGHAHSANKVVVEDARRADCAGCAPFALRRASRAVVLLTAKVPVRARCGVSALGFVFKEPDLTGGRTTCTLAASE